ncbi:MAG: XTP/dITP diphosphatase [Christensenellales bacterium]
MDNIIILATNNKSKVKEISEMMSGSDITFVSLADAGINVEVEETGTTFEENALLKAREICKLSGKPTISDDSGLEIDALDGAPGIYSSRFMGEDTSYDIKNNALIEKLENVADPDRTARFRCCMALVLPDGREFVTEGAMEGIIAREPKGINGFGYDPILFIPEYNRTSAELSSEEKNNISHRGEALRKMIEVIKKELN